MKDKSKYSEKVRLVLATSLTLLAILTYYLKLDARILGLRTGDVLMLVATISAGLPIIKTALVSLRYKIIGIDLLVSAAMVGAVIIGEYWEAAVVAILFALGHYLEARALNKSRSAIKSLVEAAPSVALVERGNELVEVSPRDVLLGDVVVVKSGQKIPVDGEVVEGSAPVNQASITGESMPINKTVGDEVYSGSIVDGGYLRVSANKVGSSTLFANILELVEDAQDKKAKTQVFLERFSTYYTPAIMILAVVVYFMSGDIYLALTLLVIACPGALIIATPVSIVAGIGNGAKSGILIKGGEAIEDANAARIVAFDKTGTLTEGKPSVVAIKAIGIESSRLLKLAAGAEEFSEHPLGVAIVEHARKSLPGSLPNAKETFILTGMGVKAEVDKSVVLVGNRQLMKQHGILLPDAVEKYQVLEEEKGRTAMLVAKSGLVVGVISVADTIRSSARVLIDSIRASGRKVVMLTGDNKSTAQAIARQLNVDEFYSELLPKDKVAHIVKLQEGYGKVVMVGDGVNDAPALATADVGVAIGGIGKDVAMETADIVLLSGDIAKLSYVLSLSRAVVRNMKVNIYFAVGLVAVLLVGVLTKNVIMSFGMLIHVASVLLVIMNATRLLRYNK